MNLKEMRNIVKKELGNIPRGQMPQNELRMEYWIRRMNSLGKKSTDIKDRRKVIEESIAHLKKTYSDFEFEYNKEYFMETKT
jgi:hypothetical protein